MFVTHDQEEALELADRVVVMNEGRIEQDGRPEDVFEHPATPFVMNFLGSVNIFHGRVEEGKALLGPLAVDTPSTPDATPQPAAGYARPHELDLGRTDDGGGGLWARLLQVNTTGGIVKLELTDDGGQLIQVELGRDVYKPPRAGDRRAAVREAAALARVRVGRAVAVGVRAPCTIDQPLWPSTQRRSLNGRGLTPAALRRTSSNWRSASSAPTWPSRSAAPRTSC